MAQQLGVAALAASGDNDAITKQIKTWETDQ